MLIGQFGKNREINAIFGKAFCVLGHAEFFEPLSNLPHRDPSRGSAAKLAKPVNVNTTCARESSEGMARFEVGSGS